MRKALKIIAGILLGLIVLGLLGYRAGQPAKNITWGINFSTVRAVDLGLQPDTLFMQILNDLHPQEIRLPVYWEEIEPVQNQFNFDLYDKLLAETDQRNIKVIIVLGHKLPRWPECHQPDWYNNLSTTDRNTAILNMIQTAALHLKTHSSIADWQIENEPFFPYGPECNTVDKAFYRQELAAMRQIDSRPIVGTDSGEKGAWLPTAWSGVDILGATMYREVFYNKKNKYTTYPLPAWTYNVKAGLVRMFSGANQTIGVELQAEPWFISDAQHTAIPEQLQHMNPTIFQQHIEYAKQTGFAENYLWGVEWWYWLASRGDGSMVQAAKNLFQQ